MPRRVPGDGRLSPYSGPEIYRIQRLGTTHTVDRYGDDLSGEHLYRFNSLGFRGADFDAAAPHRVFAFGESEAFGFGVDFDRCWPSRFVERWLDANRLDRRDVCYLNFAEAGASNGAIARAVVSQCSAAPPDLVLVHFGDPRRSEIFLDGRSWPVGPWLLDEPAARTARQAPREENLRRNLEELLDRGRHFYRFGAGSDALGPFSIETDSYFVLETLRDILLVQYFCRARGIRALATWEHIRQLDAGDVRRHPSLGPLAEQIDPGFLCDFSIWDVDGETTADRQHAGPARHDAFARALLEFHRRTAREEPASKRRDRPATASPRAASAEDRRVRAFYEKKPFNHWRSPAAAAESLEENPIVETYPDLHRLLERDRELAVLDCGCGGGWLASALALHYGAAVIGLDFSTTAVARARAVADRLGVARRARFVAGDLFELRFDGRFDLAIGLGVLHHAADARRAFEHLWRTVRPGGHVYAGLYHEPGRSVFRHHFRELLASHGEEAAFDEFRRLHPSRPDGDHLRSWFEDQVLHPRESQHTLREVCEWLAAAELELTSTSINRFGAFRRAEDLYELEADYAGRSRRALKEGRFLPGFFTFMARRPDSG